MPARGACAALTATHPIDPEPRRRLGVGAASTIADNVWLEGGAIVPGRDDRRGHRRRRGGGVVTRDLPAGVVAVGAPARVLR